MNANRRLQERKQPERVVFCKLGGEGSSLVLDLSEDGLCFESLTPIEEKDTMQLHLSLDPDSPIEATGKLAWIDSAKRTGGLRFLDLSAPAREQIRAWLSEISPASSEKNSRVSLQKRDKQADDGAATEKPAILEKTLVPSVHLLPKEQDREEPRVPSMLLVPIERYRKQTRAQFLRGVLVGFAIWAVAMIPIVRYAGGTKPGTSTPRTASANDTAQSSGELTNASVAQPASESPSMSKPAAAKLLATQPAAVQTVFAAAPIGSRQKQNPQQSPSAAGASSTDLMVRTSSPPARPQPAKAEQPREASPGAVATAPAASKVNFSSGQPPHPKKVTATPQQLWSALQAGDISAAVALADLYERGEGVPVNCEQARVLLLAASAKHNAEASKKLQALNKGGCPANTE